MDAIRNKYNALAAKPLDVRRKETAAFAKTLKEIVRADVTEDGNICCVFTDKVPYLILGNVGVPSRKPDKESASVLGSNPFESLYASLPQSTIAPLGSIAAPKLQPLSEVLGLSEVQAFEPNDLPVSLKARIVNALGSVFGNSCDEVRTILTDKGYSVAPGVDGSIATLMGLKDLGVFYMQCHGGNGIVWDFDENKWETEYIIVSSEEWSQAKEDSIREMVIPGQPGGLIASGFIGMCEALYDVDANGKDITKRYFTITKKFVRTFWRFSQNSFVLIYGCTTTRMSDAMADSKVNASVYVGTNDLGNNGCHKWIKLLFDRLTGTNNDAYPPPEDTCPQRPFDWVKLHADFSTRKQLWPITETYRGQPHPCSPIFRANRDNFGLLTPTIAYVVPVAYQPRLNIIGTFGKDPGDRDRKVTIRDVAQVVEKWEPDKITILLANNGVDGYGELKVFSRGRPSNSRFMTKWTGNINIHITGEQTLSMKADFAVDMIGDPWSYRKDPGVKPVDQFSWPLLTVGSSTCNFGASGQYSISGKIVHAWSGQLSPKPWFDENMGRQNTFGVGAVGDGFQKKVNIFLAIIGTFSYNDHGNVKPAPIKLGDWMQGQTLFQANFTPDFGIVGDTKEIEDEPSKLSYGGINAVLKWDSMQGRYGMPRAAAR